MFNLSQDVKGGTLCLSKAGLAVGSSGATVDIAAPNGAGVDYAINGKLYHKADATNNAISAGTVVPALYSCLFLVELDTSGNVTTKQGTAVLTASIGKVPLNWPEPTSGKCPIGAFRIDCATGYTYTPGTTLNSATGITDTYYDLLAVPDAPIVS